MLWLHCLLWSIQPVSRCCIVQAVCLPSHCNLRTISLSWLRYATFCDHIAAFLASEVRVPTLMTAVQRFSVAFPCVSTSLISAATTTGHALAVQTITAELCEYFIFCVEPIAALSCTFAKEGVNRKLACWTVQPKTELSLTSVRSTQSTNLFW